MCKVRKKAYIRININIIHAYPIQLDTLVLYHTILKNVDKRLRTNVCHSRHVCTCEKSFKLAITELRHLNTHGW